jgi:hypothetical protein
MVTAQLQNVLKLIESRLNRMPEWMGPLLQAEFSALREAHGSKIPRRAMDRLVEDVILLERHQGHFVAYWDRVLHSGGIDRLVREIEFVEPTIEKLDARLRNLPPDVEKRLAVRFVALSQELVR